MAETFHGRAIGLMETGGGFGFGGYDVGGGRGGAAAGSGGSGDNKSLLSFSSAASATSAAAAAVADTLFFSQASSASPGGMMGSSRAGFTVAQREELERQKLIFKYMLASIPVPPQLLLPLKSNSTIAGSTRNSSSSSSDPEPWRCKRTDGKKWRCSRDVAPHQKYCERHSHKNRPRSRKPVEFLSNNATNKPLTQSRDSSFISSSVAAGQESLSHLIPYQTQKEFSNVTSSATATSRCLEWFMKGEVIGLPNSNPFDWQHPPQQQQRHGPPSPYGPDHELQAQGGGRSLMNDQCSLLLGMASLEGHGCPKGSDSLSKRAPASSLSLAMFGGGGGEEAAGEGGGDGDGESIGQMGLCVGPSSIGSGRECDRRAESKPHWMSPGGPLAEALCLGTTNIRKSSPSDRT